MARLPQAEAKQARSRQGKGNKARQHEIGHGDEEGRAHYAGQSQRQPASGHAQ